MHKDVQKAAEVLQSGGVVIFPTDTVYGIGCRLDDEDAVRRVFQTRNRPEEKAVLAVVDSVAQAQEYLKPISQDVCSKLIEKYWPGPLTIILPCQTDRVPSVARAGGNTLAVRQTNHSVLLRLIQEVGAPLIAPSANFAGGKTPTSFAELDPKLISLVDYVLEGECGGSVPSTIIDCSVSPWKIVREGAIKIDV